jgi:aldose 1-epimerase
MSFVVQNEKFGPYTKIAITNLRGACIVVIPEMGARLNNFLVQTKSGFIDIIDGYSSVDELSTEYYAKGSLLAPFPNRIADGRYTFEGTEYQLTINKIDENNAIHGFISNKPFSILSSGEVANGYELSLLYTSGIVEGYPFRFEILVNYNFQNDNRLTITTEVRNSGATNMPIGFGWHPYFTTCSKINDIALRLPSVRQFDVDDRLIPTSATIEMGEWSKAQKISESEFDTGFEFATDDKIIILLDEEKDLDIRITCMEGYEYVQVFTPPWRSAIAIEPMTCAADAFNNKFGLKTLSPMEKLSASFEIKVNELG